MIRTHRNVPARFLPLVVACLLSVAASSGPAWPGEPGATAPREPSASYRLAPGDLLRVVVWGEENLDLTLRVRPDGFVTLPMIHDVYAAGRTPGELGKTVERKLAAFVRHPDVAVIVEEANGIRISVLGEVNDQGSYRFHHVPTLLEALAAAGGITETARGRVLIIRHVGRGDMRREFDLGRFLRGQKGLEDPRLVPGEIVIVE